MIQVTNRPDFASESDISSGEVLVWVPAAICLAMMVFFLLFGSVGSGASSGTGEDPHGATCGTSRTGTTRC